MLTVLGKFWLGKQKYLEITESFDLPAKLTWIQEIRTNYLKNISETDWNFVKKSINFDDVNTYDDLLSLIKQKLNVLHTITVNHATNLNSDIKERRYFERVTDSLWDH